MKSMTGYGSAECSIDGIGVEAEIRSWNHKGLDMQVRLSDAFSFMEPQLRDLVAAVAVRGKILCSVRVKGALPDRKIFFDRAAVESLLDPLIALAREKKLQPSLSLTDIMEIPNAVVIEESPSERIQRGLVDTLAAATAKWDASRAAEGGGMKAAVHGFLEACGGAVTEIAARRPGAVAEMRRRMTQKITELAEESKVKVDQSRLEFEIATLAEKADVEEELVRLDAHLKAFRKVVDGGGKRGASAGAELGFILQEMLRESNTIGSKCQDLEITRQVISLKTAIDRLKEVCANVV